MGKSCSSPSATGPLLSGGALGQAESPAQGAGRDLEEELGVSATVIRGPAVNWGFPTGRAFREDLCLDAAQAVEDRIGTLTPVAPRAEGGGRSADTAAPRGSGSDRWDRDGRARRPPAWRRVQGWWPMGTMSAGRAGYLTR
ncbi:hypothetical protein ACQI4E_29540 [Streptomyces sp. CA-252508]|uniref:hypothetical protein n=1 Tax=Streptomyces sp. CA-252508 TaxID=3418946 RepID=UPI003D92F936